MSSTLQLTAATLNPCVLGELPCMGGGLTGFQTLIANQIPVFAEFFYAALFVMLMVYAITLIVQSGNESAIEEGRKAFTFAVIGSLIVFFRFAIYDVFQPGDGALIDSSPVGPIASSALAYIRIIAAAAAVGFVTIRAIRLMMAGGDEGNAQTQRKLFLNAVYGVGILVLATSIVDIAFPGGANIISEEMTGILLYVLIICGALIVLGIVVGAVLLVLSYDEGLKDRAKKSIIAGIVVLIVLSLLGAIISLLG